jgi:hypothetical protein
VQDAVQFETACETSEPFVATNFTDCNDPATALFLARALAEAALIVTVTLAVFALFVASAGCAGGGAAPGPPLQALTVKRRAQSTGSVRIALLHLIRIRCIIIRRYRIHP